MPPKKRGTQIDVWGFFSKMDENFYPGFFCQDQQAFWKTQTRRCARSYNFNLYPSYFSMGGDVFLFRKASIRQKQQWKLQRTTSFSHFWIVFITNFEQLSPPPSDRLKLYPANNSMITTIHLATLMGTITYPTEEVFLIFQPLKGICYLEDHPS